MLQHFDIVRDSNFSKKLKNGVSHQIMVELTVNHVVMFLLGFGVFLKFNSFQLLQIEKCINSYSVNKKKNHNQHNNV